MGEGGKSGQRALPLYAQINQQVCNHCASARDFQTSQKPWASVTFAGWRMAQTFAFAIGDDFKIREMPDMEFNLPNYLVADVTILEIEIRDTGDCTATIEWLLIEE